MADKATQLATGILEYGDGSKAICIDKTSPNFGCLLDLVNGIWVKGITATPEALSEAMKYALSLKNGKTFVARQQALDPVAKAAAIAAHEAEVAIAVATAKKAEEDKAAADAAAVIAAQELADKARTELAAQLALPIASVPTP